MTNPSDTIHSDPIIQLIRELLAERGEIALIWCISDVQSIRPELSDDQAREILEECELSYDRKIGLTWQIIEKVANDLFPVDDVQSHAVKGA